MRQRRQTGTREARATAPPDIPAAWQGILEPGETILWQGRPDQRFHMPLENLFGAIVALVFVGFAIFWISATFTGGDLFWLFGLIHLTIGLRMMAGFVFGPTWRHRHMWYTLTDRRAFIATNLPLKGKTLDSYPIRPDTPIKWVDSTPPGVQFATETRKTSKGRRYRMHIGFERIAEAREVMEMISEIRNQAQSEGAPER